MAQKLQKKSVMELRRTSKTAPQKLGVYIHVPFCAQKCKYCDFYSKPCTKKGELQSFTDAVCKHIDEYFCNSAKQTIDTIYFGGGTPSLLKPAQIKKILSAIKKNNIIEDDAEITLECNPESADYKFLKSVRKIGVNRVSFGVQSACDSELLTLGRIHSFDDAKRAVEDAKRAKIANISLDLMYGLPSQTMQTWQQSVEQIIALAPQHISAYALKLEENTPLYQDIIVSKNKSIGEIPNDDVQADMYFWLVDRLLEAGFAQYEISNFAQEGFKSRHNSRYWDLSPYLGFGPAAHSFYGNRRFSFAADTQKYINSANSSTCVEFLESDEEFIDAPRHGEYIMLRLRTSEGVDVQKFQNMFKLNFEPYAKILNKYTSNGFCKFECGRWFLTKEGFFVSNTIIADVLGDTDI